MERGIGRSYYNCYVIIVILLSVIIIIGEARCSVAYSRRVNADRLSIGDRRFDSPNVRSVFTYSRLCHTDFGSGSQAVVCFLSDFALSPFLDKGPFTCTFLQTNKNVQHYHLHDFYFRKMKYCC